MPTTADTTGSLFPKDWPRLTDYAPIELAPTLATIDGLAHTWVIAANENWTSYRILSTNGGPLAAGAAMYPVDFASFPHALKHLVDVLMPVVDVDIWIEAGLVPDPSTAGRS